MPVSYFTHRVRIGMFHTQIKKSLKPVIMGKSKIADACTNPILTVITFCILLSIPLSFIPNILVYILTLLAGTFLLITTSLVHLPVALVLWKWNRIRYFNSRWIIQSTVATSFLLMVPGFSTLLFIPNLSKLLLVSGDIHPNPGPLTSGLRIASININSISADDGNRFDCIQNFANTHETDVILVCESGCFDDKELDKYILNNFHEPYHLKKGRGLFAYVRNNLPLIIRNDLLRSFGLSCLVKIGMRKPLLVSTIDCLVRGREKERGILEI